MLGNDKQACSRLATGTVRPAVEKLGGKIETGWFCFGDYDPVSYSTDA
jgi:uncharacterized protein with GYD domain